MKKYRVTERAADSEQVDTEVSTYDVVSDGVARTIAQWYHSPNHRDTPFVQLGQGSEFDVRELSERLETCGMYPTEYRAMRDWVDNLFDRLEGDN